MWYGVVGNSKQAYFTLLHGGFEVGYPEDVVRLYYRIEWYK